MKIPFLIAALAPQVLFGVLADKDWIKRTFAPTNAAAVAEAAAVTNAQQASSIAGLQSSKQDVISDLSSIRSGATAGSTAVQPSAISDMASKTWVGQQGFAKSAEIQYPVTDVRTGGVSIVSNGIADFTIPDVELPETWPWESVSGRPTAWAWVKGLSGFPSWVTDSSPLSDYPKKTSALAGTIGDQIYVRGILRYGVGYSEYANDAYHSDCSDYSRSLSNYGVGSMGRYPRYVSFQTGDCDSSNVGRIAVYADSGERGPSSGDSVEEIVAWVSEIPTKVSDLTNDSGFLTDSFLSSRLFGSSVASIVRGMGLASASLIPTKTSDLTNDSGFITSSDVPSVPTKVSDLQIDDVTTNVIREVTGTFWDPGLAVTWRMFCSNGCFYVSAITNVNVTGVTP